MTEIIAWSLFLAAREGLLALPHLRTTLCSVAVSPSLCSSSGTFSIRPFGLRPHWRVCAVEFGPWRLRRRSVKNAPNSAPHRDGREASPLGRASPAPARGRERWVADWKQYLRQG